MGQLSSSLNNTDQRRAKSSILTHKMTTLGHAAQHATQRILNDDIILDSILPDLNLEDIVSVRQVNNQLRRCSNEPAVWKRVLTHTERQLPPVPPTERYSLANISQIEAERLLTRSLSLPKRWNQHRPQHFRRWEIEAQRKVLEMALLPGGHYLVATVADRNPMRYCIEVYTSDFNYSMGFPIARLTTPSKAFHLRAKYLSIHGRPGIAIAYIRRNYRRESFKDEFDINRLAPDSDWFSAKVKYECAVMHVPLQSLELLFDNDKPWDPKEYRTRALQQDRPFQVLTEITSRARMSNPIIDEDRNGIPLVAVLKHPDRIVYKNLDGGQGCTMYCAPHPSYQNFAHAIMAFTFVPSQHQFLLVRRAGEDPDPLQVAADLADLPPGEILTGPYYFAELYDVKYTIDGASLTCDAASRTAVHDAGWNFWHKVWITHPGMGAALKNDVSVRAELQSTSPTKPLPITIFVQADRSYGLVFNTFFPEPVPASSSSDMDANASTRYMYVLSEDDPFIETEPLPEGMESLNDLYEHRILLGSTRPVIYTIPRQGSKANSFQVRMLGGVWDEDLLDKPPATVEAHAVGSQDVPANDAAHDEEVNDHDEEPEEDADEGNEDNEEDADEGSEDNEEDGQSDVLEESSRIRVSHQFNLELADLDHVSAVAWDETIGRLCIGYANSTRIAVFDFAGAPVPAHAYI
ncbi:hypothetical protein BD309DRAFT_1020833 [Dichomitus squalens]|nr:hypothetical protein BD309DRAFT_1020833 [Dichomitus squalens]